MYAEICGAEILQMCRLTDHLTTEDEYKRAVGYVQETEMSDMCT